MRTLVIKLNSEDNFKFIIFLYSFPFENCCRDEAKIFISKFFGNKLYHGINEAPEYNGIAFRYHGAPICTKYLTNFLSEALKK